MMGHSDTDMATIRYIDKGEWKTLRESPADRDMHFTGEFRIPVAGEWYLDYYLARRLPELCVRNYTFRRKVAILSLKG